MSAFEISITPTRLKAKKRMESREPTAVMMAPFTAKAIVQFEDVPVTKTAKRILRVINPSDEDIQVKVMKMLPEEHNITIDWSENVIPAQSEIAMEMVWSPLMEVACKETLHFQDNRNFRKDVMIILKSKNNNPPKNTRKFPTVGKTLRLKSPTGNKKSGKIIVHQQRRLQTTKPAATTNALPSTTMAKQNIACQKAPQKVHTIVSETMSNAQIAPLTERNIYLGPQEREPPTISPQTPSCKENISPLTPGNVMSFIDKLKFTPATDTISSSNALGDLVSWPTPVGDYTLPIDTVKTLDVRPRRLASDLSPEPLSTTNHVIIDKTFDVKHSEILNFSTDTLDSSHLQTQPLNKTSTVAHAAPTRPLTVIREEDGNSPPGEVVIKVNKVSDLKRDIKMVGSPLRKFSESMKDLSIQSPQTKVAIQGSMPNLNEMEQIRSIEQNRYYQQQIIDQHKEQPQRLAALTQTQCANSLDSSNVSESSLISHTELMFDQHEILAQSSRFNLNEVGIKSRKNSPLSLKVEKQYTRKKSPTNPAIKSIASINASNSAQKRRSHELSFSDAQSTESLSTDVTMPCTSSKAMMSLVQISPPKRQRVEFADTSLLRSLPTNASAPRPKNWPQVQPKKYKLAQTLSLMKKPLTPRKTREQQPCVKLYDSELYLQSYINPDPFAATTTADPFLASTMYLDERAVERHQVDFKKWLNALVSLPADLDADCNTKIDVGKLFNEVRNKELIIAQTKEEQSMNYLTKFRLESLRRAAVELFFSEEMRVPCSKVAVYVNKQALRIRKDRNLHLDVVMQRYILELLLCFNPLWLRLGLEVVYAEKIHLHSNSDIVGLSTFILNRLFRNKFEEQKYSKAYTLSEEYAENIKKYTLQKMLFLLLFLDKAKEKRIIKHNPCLFVKKSPHKETKDILLRVASELLANIGDITREMKRFGYVLQHKQTYLDEFDYAFNNLAVDLRDGIRLTRVMEVILLRDGLSKQLRVPAISRLQRIFNVNLALRALSEADFQLKGEITAADIVDGHREKTLSLLWQIIYKFRSPKFHAAARVLQHWWRHAWLRVVIMRRIRHKEEMRRQRAATVIQAHYRGHQMRKYVKVYREERLQAAIILQKYVRRYLAQKHLYQAYASIVLLQRWYRSQRVTLACRTHFLRVRESAIFLQRIWRRRLFAGKLLLAAEQARLQRNQKMQAAAMCIQMHWQSWRLAQKVRTEYQRQRTLIVRVQQRLRANWSMKKQRQCYLQLQQTTINVQRRYRAKRLMLDQRHNYLKTRAIIVGVQQRWRSILKMRLARNEFIQLKRCAEFVQRTLRAKWQAKAERAAYLQLKTAAIVCQQRYRARLGMKQQLSVYMNTREKIILIQRKWRATLLMRRQRVQYISLVYYATILQQKHRATKAMRKDRAEFLQLQKTVIQVQRQYRAKLQARHDLAAFRRLRSAALTIQRRFRAHKQMRFLRAKYQGTQAAVACLQMHIRSYLLMKQLRCDYQRRRNAAITLQRAYRRRLLMLKERSEFLQLNEMVLNLQRRRRATLEMRQQRIEYQRQRKLIISCQIRYRAKLLGHQVRQTYTHTLAIIINVQHRFRANLLMRECRSKYLADRTKIVHLQQRFKAQLAMKREQRNYQTQRRAVTIIQRWYRGILDMRQVRSDYKRVRRSSLTIQRKWRATLAARVVRNWFTQTVDKVRIIQRAVRATIQMRQERLAYQRQREAAIVLQRQFRSRQLMLKLRNQYLLIRTLIIVLQQKYRARRAMLAAREDFLLLKRTTIHLQQKFRGRIIMREERQHFVLLSRNVVDFQAHARGLLARKRFQAFMTPEMIEFLRRKKAAKIIQRYWRGYRTRKRLRNVAIQAIRKRVVKLQQESKAVDSVRTKVQDAVRFLRGRFIASDALAVLNRLDRLSRTVPHLLTSSSEFMCTFCYGIMAQAIRSEVDKQLIECCSRIILNLARYNSTTLNTFQENGLVTIAQMLLRWCDKDCEIFNTLCTLIWVFAHCPKKRRIIRDYMTTTDAIYMVRETKKLVARKEKMKQNTRKPALGLVRSNSQQQNFSARALPSLEPDYGIIRYRPYTFISSVYALDTILCKLGIDII